MIVKHFQMQMGLLFAKVFLIRLINQMDIIF